MQAKAQGRESGRGRGAGIELFQSLLLGKRAEAYVIHAMHSLRRGRNEALYNRGKEKKGEGEPSSGERGSILRPGRSRIAAVLFIFTATVGKDALG